VVLYVLGERLEDIGIENSKSALDELVSKAPKTAFVKSQNEFVPIDKIAVGTIVQIKPGEMIPLDGKNWFASDSSFVNRSFTRNNFIRL